MTKKIRTFSRDPNLVAERRKQIAINASKLFLRKGYEHTNTRELSDFLGMSKGTLYHYIGSKNDVLYLVLSVAAENQPKLIERMSESVSGLPVVEALRESIRMYFANVDDIQDMYNFNNHAIVDLAPKDRHILFDAEEVMVSYFDSLLKRGIEAGVFRTCTTELVAHNIVLAANAWAHRRWFLRKRYTLDEYTREQTEHVLKAICADSEPQAE